MMSEELMELRYYDIQRSDMYGEGRVASTLSARDYKSATDIVQRKYMLRRLTPLECCRLQGFPDWWDADVPGSDSNRYMMWGNGIALPCAADVLGRIKALVDEEEDILAYE